MMEAVSNKNNESKVSLLNLLSAAIDFYNNTRSPEASARLLEVREEYGIAVVEFNGEFCASCGVRDWVEDLAYIIKSMGYDAKLIKYVESSNEVNFRRLGVFKVML